MASLFIVSDVSHKPPKPKGNLTTIRAKVVHDGVLAVGCLGDFAWCSGDFDLRAVGDEVVGVG